MIFLVALTHAPLSKSELAGPTPSPEVDCMSTGEFLLDTHKSSNSVHCIYSPNLFPSLCDSGMTNIYVVARARNLRIILVSPSPLSISY